MILVHRYSILGFEVLVGYLFDQDGGGEKHSRLIQLGFVEQYLIGVLLQVTQVGIDVTIIQLESTCISITVMLSVEFAIHETNEQILEHGLDLVQLLLEDHNIMCSMCICIYIILLINDLLNSSITFLLIRSGLQNAFTFDVVLLSWLMIMNTS